MTLFLINHVLNVFEKRLQVNEVINNLLMCLFHRNSSFCISIVPKDLKFISQTICLNYFLFFVCTFTVFLSV